MPDPRAKLILSADNQTARAFREVEGALNSFQRVARTVSRAVPLLAAGFGIRELAAAAGAFNEIEGRLRSLGSSTEDYRVKQQALMEFSQQHGVSVRELAKAYSEAALKARAAGEDEEAAGQRAMRALRLQAEASGEVDQAHQRLGNSMTFLLGKISDASGLTDLWTASVNGLSRAIDDLSNSDTTENLKESFEELRQIENRLAVPYEEIGGFGVRLTDQEIAALEKRAATLRAFHLSQLQEVEVTAKRMVDVWGRGQTALREIDVAAIQRRRKDQIDAVPSLEREMAERRFELEQRQAEENKRRREQLIMRLEDVRTFTMSEVEQEANAHARRQEILRQALQAELIDRDRYAKLTEDLEARTQANIARIRAREQQREKQLRMAQLAGIAGLFSAIAAISSVGAEQSKKKFEQDKKIQTAAAIVNTLAGATMALSSAPFPANIINAAAVAAFGFAQVRAIRSTTWQGGDASLAGGGASAGAASPTSAAAVTPGFAAERAASRSEPTIVVNITPGVMGHIDRNAAVMIGEEIRRAMRDKDF